MELKNYNLIKFTTMSTAEIISQLEELPEEQKKSVSDYIAFLLEKATKENAGKPKPKAVFGSMKGMFKMAPDFDEPLEEFKDYM